MLRLLLLLLLSLTLFWFTSAGWLMRTGEFVGRSIGWLVG